MSAPSGDVKGSANLANPDINFSKGVGEGAISPPGFFELLLRRLGDVETRQTYIDMAARASETSAGAGNKIVEEFLEGLGLEHFVDGQPEPERTHLLEALRVMGIRFRRFARYPQEWDDFLALLYKYDGEMAW